MFHPLVGLTAQEKQDANVRILEGDGTPYLIARGLKEVVSVRVGATPLPLTQQLEYPIDASLSRVHVTEVPMVSLQIADDGTPVLLRSGLSNDGMWQKGVKIYVGGVWEDGDKPAAPPAPDENAQSDTARADAAKALDRLTRDDLLAKAAELGVSVPDGATKAQIIEALLSKPQ